MNCCLLPLGLAVLGEMADPGKAFPELAGDGKESGKGLPRLPGTHTAPFLFSLSPNKESLGYPHQESSAIRVHMVSLESEVSKWPGNYIRLFFRVFHFEYAVEW